MDSSNRDNISKTRLAVSGDRTINTLLVSELMKAKLNNTPGNVVDTYLIDRGYLSVGESKTYDIRLWIDYEATSYDGSFVSKIIVDSYVKGQEPIYLQSNLASTWKDKTTLFRNFLALYTIDTKTLPSTYSYNNEIYNLTNTIDVSEQENGEVLLGEYKNGDKAIAVLGQEEGVIAPVISSGLFTTDAYANPCNFELIDLKNMDFSNATTLVRAFYNSRKLKKINIDNINTPNITKIGCMFQYCVVLEDINVDNLDISNVTDVAAMFYACRKLKTIDVTYFDTSNVVSMSHFFSDDSDSGNMAVEQIIGLENFDTSNVIDMKWMFCECRNLKSLDLSSFNTSKVTNMSKMFYGTRVVSSIKVGCNWVVNEGVSVTDMFTNSKVSEVTKICSL